MTWCKLFIILFPDKSTESNEGTYRHSFGVAELTGFSADYCGLLRLKQAEGIFEKNVSTKKVIQHIVSLMGGYEVELRGYKWLEYIPGRVAFDFAYECLPCYSGTLRLLLAAFFEENGRGYLGKIDN